MVCRIAPAGMLAAVAGAAMSVAGIVTLTGLEGARR